MVRKWGYCVIVGGAPVCASACCSCMLEQGGADASPLVGAVVFSFYSSPPLCQWGQIMSAIINRGEHASQSIHSTTTQDSTHSMPSSLMTDEDWDQLLAKEQQESRPSCISSSGADAMEDVQGGSVSPLKVGGKGANGAKSTHTSPIKVGRDSGHHSTPSSPSEILRLTRRNTGPSEERGSTVEEAAQFEKELGDWVRAPE
jgi:hypothetical protein